MREKEVPASMQVRGYNGANFPQVTAEELNAVLTKRHVGRASRFTLELAADIIEAVSDGLTWKQIAEQHGVDRVTIWSWEHCNPAFANAIADAHKLKARSFCDDQLNIVAEVEIDPENPKIAQAELRKAEIMGRFRFDQAKCFDPDQYGDKRRIDAHVVTESSEDRLRRLTQYANVIEITGCDDPE